MRATNTQWGLLNRRIRDFDGFDLEKYAKSIIRFGESQTNNSEYVSAGALLSIFIAVMAGFGMMMSHKII